MYAKCHIFVENVILGALAEPSTASSKGTNRIIFAAWNCAWHLIGKFINETVVWWPSHGGAS